MISFENVSKYAGQTDLLPTRGTANSAGYDFYVAEDIIVPSYFNLVDNLIDVLPMGVSPKTYPPISLSTMNTYVKESGAKPTLVPTGVKCYLEDNTYLELMVRSSTPLKSWIILANSVGVIDADYADNPDNEGHIYFQVINLSPFDIQLKRGDRIGQGIIKPYLTTTNDNAKGARTGGFGSTSN